jgi:hypothetical protein
MPPQDDIEQIFTGIYLTNAWGNAESRSGPGATVDRTRLLRPSLEALVGEWDVRSILDLPCGDFNWMRLVDLASVDYTGGDIVPAIVEGNTALYAAPGRTFRRIDMLRDTLPKADLILCRDGLVHFSFRDIARSIQAMKLSNSSYLLATSFTGHPANEDIPTGGWRPLNLDLHPFGFPQPLSVIWDGPRPDGTYPDKILALYRIGDLPGLTA